MSFNSLYEIPFEPFTFQHASLTFNSLYEIPDTTWLVDLAPMTSLSILFMRFSEEALAMVKDMVLAFQFSL